MKIRRTTKNDIERLMDIYAYARKFMAEHGNPNQWGPTNWPPRDVILEDIELGNSYAVLNDNDVVIGGFCYKYGVDVEEPYLGIEEGEWKDNSAYGVIHRLAGDGSEKGIAEFSLNWAFNESGHLRVDTHEDNLVMQNILDKMNFERRGIIHVIEDNHPRIAYEKSK